LSDFPLLKNGIGFSNASNSFLGQQPFTNYKLAPTYLSLNLSGTISPGTITVAGLTLTKVENIVYKISNSNLTQDLSQAIRSYLNVNSNYKLPNSIKIAKIISFEKVETDDNLNVLSSIHMYNLHGYSLQNNYITNSIAIQDLTLKNTEFKLSDSIDNLNNLPKIGDKVKITFYYFTYQDSENINFNKQGILYSNKKYVTIDSIGISSGFLSTSSGNALLSVNCLNQPASQSKYRAYYDYIAPKQNERIFIEYNYEKLIGDITLQIEDNTRRTGDDVLVKSMIPVFVDVSIAIVIINSSNFQNSSDIIKQNVQNIITTLLNATKANTSLDMSDVENEAYKVPGVDRTRILYFNKTGLPGSTLTIQAKKNEFLVANKVTVTIENK
jgi:hypothetical protein